jgi:outer membrane protein
VGPSITVEDPRWYVRAGAAGLIYSPSANLSVGGFPVSGASVSAPSNVTALVELGYFLTPNVALQFTGGYPPTVTLNGAGVVASLGQVGRVTYGPAALTLNYAFKNFGPIQPYLGFGAAYAIIFENHDGAVKDLNVNGNFGLVLQGGVDYFVTRNWSVYVDAKYLFLKVHANGNVGGIPASATITADPTVVSGGVAYHW